MSSSSEQDTPQTASPVLEPVDENLAIIARQAIVDEHRTVYGYELFDRSTASNAHTATSDAALLFNALSYAGTEALVGKKTMFINCTHDSLLGAHLELIHPEKVVLEVPPLPDDSTPAEIEGRIPTLQALRTRGFRLAFDQRALRRAYTGWLPLAAFIKLDLQAVKPEQAGPLISFISTHSRAMLIAEKVETAEQYELMRRLGVKLYQGYWFARPSLVKATTIRPAQASIIQLINLVRKQASTSEIEELLKKDPSLSFNLLRFINSSGFGLSCEVTSFRHAVMILGLNKLFRWAALLMTTSRGGGGAPPAVGQTAVVRGRLMELLAAELLPPEECDNAFVVGLFSLLDSMLGMPLEKALASVALPEPVMGALLHGTGVFAPFLELVKACESGDEAVFARTTDALQLSNRQVNWAHLQALTWAESLNV
ncbi:HDOD domain-containing protein [Verminephrobacter aporrectodeae subsp. tuberculatae]|uniref:EAL and HDOD domain-containing protein n=1 Tax=Verminephrobacter aporrectodeae TaxID=1110389 RepID=UPI00223801D6|nr:HDOD domain-containing protein [Verminephrobacter aporrectodeae]MCW5221290.1 HDOD domain-containing protein [Verminephrobacter aporrectodeae subsp. tuberculatae]MCW5255045.1 HDOD domain-containing protein [Verminephrobacter aporrectodeae subsp. tuberculatae]MCW5290581.1 HDOD domain-containing protein [Verminephrobacter aporrectodeae subsp. tuberculatae]MCW8199880.1 HDOD domain-containing protein [Verminephrobacter aporrectodeae subsp. tuberculatae]MCW8208541.1 HDOD domain-containing protein